MATKYSNAKDIINNIQLKENNIITDKKANPLGALKGKKNFCKK